MHRSLLLILGFAIFCEAPSSSSAQTARPKGTAPQAIAINPNGRPIAPGRIDLGCKGTSRADLPCEAIAAQAAIDQADAAKTERWISFGQAVVGFFTLLAAVGAAVFARSAALHAGRGVAEADRTAKAAEDTLKQSRDVAHSDLRAWVGIELKLLAASRSPSAAHFDVEVQISNVGKTPALRIGVDVHVYIMDSIQVGVGRLPRTDGHKHHMPSLLPGNSAIQGIGERIDNTAILTGMERARQGGCQPIVFVDAIVSYHSIFDTEDAEPRLTSIRYIAIPAVSLSEREARYRWLENGPQGVDAVIFRQQQGAPIHMS